MCRVLQDTVNWAEASTQHEWIGSECNQSVEDGRISRHARQQQGGTQAKGISRRGGLLAWNGWLLN